MLECWLSWILPFGEDLLESVKENFKPGTFICDETVGTFLRYHRLNLKLFEFLCGVFSWFFPPLVIFVHKVEFPLTIKLSSVKSITILLFLFGRSGFDWSRKKLSLISRIFFFLCAILSGPFLDIFPPCHLLSSSLAFPKISLCGNKQIGSQCLYCVCMYVRHFSYNTQIID